MISHNSAIQLATLSSPTACSVTKEQLISFCKAELDAPSYLVCLTDKDGEICFYVSSFDNADAAKSKKGRVDLHLHDKEFFVEIFLWTGYQILIATETKISESKRWLQNELLVSDLRTLAEKYTVLHDEGLNLPHPRFVSFVGTDSTSSSTYKIERIPKVSGGYTYVVVFPEYNFDGISKLAFENIILSLKEYQTAYERERQQVIERLKATSKAKQKKQATPRQKIDMGRRRLERTYDADIALGSVVVFDVASASVIGEILRFNETHAIVKPKQILGDVPEYYQAEDGIKLFYKNADTLKPAATSEILIQALNIL